MSDVRIKKIEEKEVDTILAQDIDFQGELSFDEPLMVKGRFKGQINASSDLYVGENALIEASVHANLISVKGRIIGNLYAGSQVELFSTAVVVGDIESPHIEFEKGCVFNGFCKMKVPENKQSKDV